MGFLTQLFNNNSIIAAVSFNLLVEESAEPRINYRPAASQPQTL
jgi:hypothetical protein